MKSKFSKTMHVSLLDFSELSHSPYHLNLQPLAQRSWMWFVCFLDTILMFLGYDYGHCDYLKIFGSNIFKLKSDMLKWQTLSNCGKTYNDFSYYQRGLPITTLWYYFAKKKNNFYQTICFYLLLLHVSYQYLFFTI